MIEISYTVYSPTPESRRQYLLLVVVQWHTYASIYCPICTAQIEGIRLLARCRLISLLDSYQPQTSCSGETRAWEKDRAAASPSPYRYVLQQEEQIKPPTSRLTRLPRTLFPHTRAQEKNHTSTVADTHNGHQSELCTPSHADRGASRACDVRDDRLFMLPSHSLTRSCE